MTGIVSQTLSISDVEEFAFPLFTSINEPARPLTCSCGHWFHLTDMLECKERILRGKPNSIEVKTMCPQCNLESEHYVRRFQQ